MDEFQQLLDKAGVKHFTAKELFYRGASDAKLKLNTDPPRALWRNILPTAIVADEARRRFGKPLRVNSAYRNAALNRAIGGASHSQHMRFCALDLGTPAPAKLYLILLDMRRAGLFRGGIGLYRTFVHVDTRGTNATWRG
jgi:hypothetical protein